MTATAQLHVEPLGDGRWRVTGGTEPHVVELDTRSWLRCDCQGFRYRARCRHVDAVNGIEVGPERAADPAPRVGAGPGLERDVPPPDAP